MDNAGNPDAASVRRQRRDVDYKKLYDVMWLSMPTTGKYFKYVLCSARRMKILL